MASRAARRAAGAALAFVLCTPARSPAAPATPAALKPRQPKLVVKAESGYFDEAFAMDAGGRRLAVVRTDGATFAKLEIIDLGTGGTSSSFDLPGKTPAVERLELLPAGQGVVVIARDGDGEAPPRSASLIDASGRAAAKVGPATAFGRSPPPAGKGSEPLLVAFDRKSGEHGAATYTITPHQLATLAAAGKPRVYRAGPGGELKTPALRMLGFFDGYTRALGERPGAYDKASDARAPARMAVLDLLTGKVVEESEIEDVMEWAMATRLRADHPDRAVFAALNQDDSGVDIVNVTGKKQAAELVIPFRLYDPKSLRDQEGPEAGAFWFSLAVDPLNPDAIKRQKPDLPMLDLYAVDGSREAKAGKAGKETAGGTRHRARIFCPRPVSWTAGADRLVVLKRFKSFTRGGDELQLYELR